MRLYHCAQTTFDNRIYAISLACDERYPLSPPTLRFNSKINLPYIDQNTGVVRARCVIYIAAPTPAARAS